MDITALKSSHPWTPREDQLQAAATLASAFYEAGHEDLYTLDQFLQDIEDGRSTVGNDNVLDEIAGFTPEMKTLLHAYGEAVDWRNLSAAGYKNW